MIFSLLIQLIFYKIHAMDNLPKDVIGLIGSELTGTNYCQFRLVNKKFAQACSIQAYFQRKAKLFTDNPQINFYNYNNVEISTPLSQQVIIDILGVNHSYYPTKKPCIGSFELYKNRPMCRNHSATNISSLQIEKLLKIINSNHTNEYIYDIPTFDQMQTYPKGYQGSATKYWAKKEKSSGTFFNSRNKMLKEYKKNSKINYDDVGVVITRIKRVR